MTQSDDIDAPTPLRGSDSRLPALLLVLAASVVCTSQLLKLQTWPSAHEGLRYSYLIDHVADGMRNGHLYPRFLPNACGGYGYPTFVFYPPAFFLLAAPIACFIGSTLGAVYATVLIAFFIGGVGAYRVSRLYCSNSTIAIGCALIFMMTPYHMSNLYVRGDLSELLASMLLPWPIYFSLVRRSSRSVVQVRACLAVSVAAVILAHPLVAMPFLPLLVAVVVLGSEESATSRFRNCFAILAGIGLASPYWLPVVLLKDSVTNHAAFDGYFRFDNHFVCWGQFFSTKWGFGDSNASCNDGMSFQLGLPHAVLSIAGAAIGIKTSRLFRVVFGCYCLLIFMMTRSSSIAWSILPVLQKMQFPWRLLAVTAVCQLVLICRLGASLGGQSLVRRRLMVLPTVVSLALWYWPIFFPRPGLIERADIEIENHRRNWLKTMNTYAGVNEFTPITAAGILAGPPLDDTPIVECVPECDVKPANDHTRHSIDVEIRTEGPTLVILNQIYFAGWEVSIDGRSVSKSEMATSLTADGRMEFAIERPGLHVVRAGYASPPGQTPGVVVGVICFLILLAVEGRERLMKAAHGTC